MLGTRSRWPHAAQVVLAVLGALFLAGCAADIGLSHPAVSGPRTVDVLMIDSKGHNPFSYQPATLRIRAGTRVVWINRSSQSHTVTQKGNRPLFDSGSVRLIAPGHRWSFVFRKTGRFAYYCLLHPFMQGTIVVRP